MTWMEVTICIVAKEEDMMEDVLNFANEDLLLSIERVKIVFMYTMNKS